MRHRGDILKKLKQDYVIIKCNKLTFDFKLNKKKMHVCLMYYLNIYL